VLSLDALRALALGADVASALEQEIEAHLSTITDPGLRELGGRAKAAIRRALAWLASAFAGPAPDQVEAGARRFALTLGRSLELLLLAHHADWSLANERDARAKVAAERFARAPFDLVEDAPVAGVAALANDVPLPAR
jgi:acyl-CoA dehydrogenase